VNCDGEAEPDEEHVASPIRQPIFRRKKQQLPEFRVSLDPVRRRFDARQHLAEIALKIPVYPPILRISAQGLRVS